jgi:hypothetical protein
LRPSAGTTPEDKNHDIDLLDSQRKGEPMTRNRLLLAMVCLSTLAAAESPPVTFNKDVLPILQKNCQTCHRPGQMAPMSLLTYQAARPWAAAMKTAVLTRIMPPWFADSRFGHFLNDRSLTRSEIDTIVKWANSGATEGDPKEAPSPLKWPEGWRVQPDIVVEGPTVEIPAHPNHNVLEWFLVTVPTGFKEDTWITSVQIKPGHPEVTHHICMGFHPHTPDIKYFEIMQQNKPRDEDGSAIPEKGPTFGPIAGPNGRGWFRATPEDCYLPGNPGTDYRDFQAAKLVPAGSDITLNLHYTPNGVAVTDHVQIGFTVAKDPPQRRYISTMASAPSDAKAFAIPPNDPNWESPPGEIIFGEDVELVSMTPHMHFRGKDITYTLIYPDGRKEIALSVPHYDFNWQLGYSTIIKAPKGTKLRVDAHFDNSVNNDSNPNPNKTVYFGEMTWEEMMVGFFGVVVDKNVDPKNIFLRRAPVPSGGK